MPAPVSASPNCLSLQPLPVIRAGGLYLSSPQLYVAGVPQNAPILAQMLGNSPINRWMVRLKIKTYWKITYIVLNNNNNNNIYIYIY